MRKWLIEIPALLFDLWWLVYRWVLTILVMVCVTVTALMLALWWGWGIRWGW